ncbi:AMP-binding protein [Hoyosella altamirensis]|uniref:Acyl-CoA synthetase (AMP-forming)/AMP-acid ligase II n=1 Tax=Hoyosella altamirensis TaxID=616997 RepID=A0A839RL90_9ACTN|nr:AMP-binding protein [Hoyosella altamirensis]MBB3037250.1 acyl-CoA synthetase (AMP-forming)/AMP-acid ligase II [Hoyosella altamirensis]
MKFPLTIADHLYRAQTVYPDRIAIVDEPNQPAQSLGAFTYREMADYAAAQAARLDQLGVPAGSRVAIISHNSARLLISLFGVSAWGRILVPVNFRLAEAEIKYIIEHSGADVVLCDPERKEVLDALDVPHKYVLGEDDDKIFAFGVTPVAWDGDEDATATLNYTSGTTARPKGVQLTHRALWLNAAIFGLHAGVNDNDVYLHTLPTFHANGWGMPYTVTGMGGKHVVIRKIDGFEILKRVQEHGVTMMCAAPAVVSAALDAVEEWKALGNGKIPGHGTLRIIVAGAPPATRTIERVWDELGWEFIQIYGLTETAPLLTFNRMRSEWRDLETRERARNLVRAGAPALGVRITTNETGEILARSNHSLDAYWENPEETDRVMQGNWFHTGDGGTVDNGYLTIADRKKDVIITGGENVSSIEVEDALSLHPAIQEVAVIGIPDQKWGELVTALVVSRDPELTGEALIAHCREHLAGYKCPKRIDFIEALPRTATGKVQKFKLRQPFWQDQDRQVH